MATRKKVPLGYPIWAWGTAQMMQKRLKMKGAVSTTGVVVAVEKLCCLGAPRGLGKDLAWQSTIKAVTISTIKVVENERETESKVPAMRGND